MVAAMLVALVPAPAAAALMDYQLDINGVVFTDPHIGNENGRLLVPARFIAERCGAQVTWEQSSQQVTIELGGRTLTMRIGQTTAYVDGKPMTLDVPPKVVGDRTVIPFRAYGEALGAKVGWYGPTRTAYFWTNTQTYTMRAGDTLNTIAAQYGMGLDQLMGLNDLTDDTLRVGAQLQVKGVVPVKMAVVSGYTVMADVTDQEGLNDVNAHKGALTDVYTDSHRVTSDGHLTGLTQETVLQAAKDNGQRAWLVVSNVDENSNFSAVLADGLVKDPATQEVFFADLLGVLKTGGYHGVEMDLEGISGALRGQFTGFLAKLRAKLQPAGYQLSVAVPGKTADDPNNDWVAAFDYKAIGQTVDRVTLMTYDEHFDGGKPGPVASLPWVENVVKYATSTIPKEKLLMGLAGYGYAWPVAGGPGISIGGATAAQLAQTGAYRWDVTAASPVVHYTDSEGVARELWYENTQSIALKVEMAKRYGIEKVAIWRLGNEGDAIWGAIR